jgi:hypothetical protein
MSILTIEFFSILVSYTLLYLLFFLTIKNKVKRVSVIKRAFLSFICLFISYFFYVNYIIHPIYKYSISNNLDTIYKSNENKIINPGFQHVAFSPSFIKDYKGIKKKSLFSFLNIDYNTDASGYVIGTPAIYYTGLYVLQWKQSYISPIQIINEKKCSRFNVSLAINSWLSTSNNFSFEIYNNGDINIKND